MISSATAIALGTYVGGWRIIKTMGSRIHKMDAAQGFAAQGSGATVILAASHVGFPLSTTHTISGAVIGSGAAKRLSAVRWGVAGNIVVAWILTLPRRRDDRRAHLPGHAHVRDGRASGRSSSRPRSWSGRGDAVRAPLARGGGAGRRARSGELAAVIATIVDWDAILQVIWVSLLAGCGRHGRVGVRDRGRQRARSSTGATGAPGEAVRLRRGGRRRALRSVIGAIVFGIVILTGD